jgi:hypothetical protein
MWKAIKDFFRFKVSPILETVLPSSLVPLLSKVNCSHEYKSTRQVWVRQSPPGITFKLTNLLSCVKCRKDQFVDLP